MSGTGEYINPQIVDATTVCGSFPTAPAPEIPRDNILYLIEEMLAIVTSKKHQVNKKVSFPWDEAYRQFWSEKLSDQKPPETEIFIVGTQKGGELPIHDRWWITRGKGLRFGSSFNSLGQKKDSEVSSLTPDEVTAREVETDLYLSLTKREHLGEPLSVVMFHL